MIRLIFQPERLPRTMTRKEWLECHRWRRMTEKEFRRQIDNRLFVLSKVGKDCVVGQDTYEQIINPPVMIFPDMAEEID